jgi:hypothetical protein
MDDKNKQTIGIFSLAGAFVVGILLTRKKLTFKISPIQWEGSMPFAPDSYQKYSFPIQNISSVAHAFRVDSYWVSGLSGEWTGVVQPGHIFRCNSGEYMPHEPGTYQLTFKLYIDNLYQDEFTWEVTVG